MTDEELAALPDMTPSIGHEVRTIDGRSVKIPMVMGFVGALYIDLDDGIYHDSAGRRWLVGHHLGKRVKRLTSQL